jgi:aspartate/methionine/tyrosine aminotransferase
VRFQDIDYLEWIIGLNWEPQYDLGTSEPQIEATAQELGLRAEDIVISGHNVFGYDQLREHLARRYGVSPENVLCTLGASMANFLLCGALIEPGDEVVVEKPAYEPLLKVPQVFGANIRRIERRFQDRYELDLGELQKVLSSKTRLILLSNLHNPSGVLLGERVLREVGEMAVAVGAHVLVDEIYLEFLFDETPPSVFHLGEHFIITNSLTKVYGLGGLRLGWALCSPDLVRRAQRLYFSLGVHNPFCAEVFGHLFLSRSRKWSRWVAGLQSRIQETAPMVQRFLRARDDLEWVEPAGGVMVFPRIKGNFSGSQLADLLRQRYDTFVVPGRFFEDDRHFRLAFGAPPKVLHQGREHLASALDELAQTRES